MQIIVTEVYFIEKHPLYKLCFGPIWKYLQIKDTPVWSSQFSNSSNIIFHNAVVKDSAVQWRIKLKANLNIQAWRCPNIKAKYR